SVAPDSLLNVLVRSTPPSAVRSPWLSRVVLIVLWASVQLAPDITVVLPLPPRVLFVRPSVPPSISSAPSTVAVDEKATAPPVRASAPLETVRLRTESAPAECVTVRSRLMTTSSLAPGVVPPLQLAPTPQSPSPEWTQVTVLGTTRSSSASSRGRKVAAGSGRRVRGRGGGGRERGGGGGGPWGGAPGWGEAGGGHPT